MYYPTSTGLPLGMYLQAIVPDRNLFLFIFINNFYKKMERVLTFFLLVYFVYEANGGEVVKHCFTITGDDP